MRYLITGGAGFIGSHLAESCVLRGHAVTVLDDLSTGHRPHLAAPEGRPGFRFVRGSVTDAALVERLAAEADAIIHLAAVVGVRLYLRAPVRTVETNVLGTHTVLRAARRRGTRVLVASTSEVYGKTAAVPMREDDDALLGATTTTRWSYAASKLVDEFLALGYWREYGLPVIITRFFNVIGPRQTGAYGMVVPRLMRQALAGEPLTVYGDGTQRRCFCDVRDVVRALHALAEHPGAAGRVFNVGGGEELTIAELASRVRAAAGSDAPIALVPYAAAYGQGYEDIPRRVPDTTRLRELTGWSPAISLDETLATIRDDVLASGASQDEDARDTAEGPVPQAGEGSGVRSAAGASAAGA